MDRIHDLCIMQPVYAPAATTFNNWLCEHQEKLHKYHTFMLKRPKMWFLSEQDVISSQFMSVFSGSDACNTHFFQTFKLEHTGFLFQGFITYILK